MFMVQASLKSQDYKVVEDFELWLGAKYQHKITNKKLIASLEGEGRLRKDASELKSLYLEPAIEYKIANWLDLGLAFRYTKHTTWKGKSEDLYRVHASTNFKYTIERFRVSYRLQYQNSDDDLFRRDTASYANNVVRNRVLLRYKIKKSRFVPYLSGELFTTISNSQLHSYNARITLGTNIKTTKKLNTKVFYRMDRELNSDNAYKIYIVGIRFVIK